MKVCIVAAGLGTRMGRYRRIAKAILPVGERAYLSTLMRQYPGGEFIIAVGHLGDQIRDYVALAHPDANVTFVEVDPYEGEGSGPLTSLMACRDHLNEPFWFMPCDSFIGNYADRKPEQFNTLYVCHTKDTEENYCGVEIHDNRVTGMHRGLPHGGYVFTGTMGIVDHEDFWFHANIALANGGTDIRDVINSACGLMEFRVRPISRWEDNGTEAKHDNLNARERKKVGKFDFSKPEEFFTRTEQRVVKFFADSEVPGKLVKRAAIQPDLFPKGIEARGHFISYPWVEGQAVSTTSPTHITGDLLRFMDDHLWTPVDEPADFRDNVMSFYRDKTHGRVNMLRKQKSPAFLPGQVQGVGVPGVDELLLEIPWDRLVEGAEPHLIHGDIHYDNLVATKDGFCLLDWRRDFAGMVGTGDVYYDYAKFLGGIRLDYQAIKFNKFSINFGDDLVADDASIWLDCHNGMFSSLHEMEYRQWAEGKGLDWDRIELLLGIIYLNMAPLHAQPFGHFLTALARWQIHRSL